MSFNLADLLEAVVDAVPDRLALVGSGVRLTFGDWEQRANRLAALLAGLGVGRDDRVALAVGNRPSYLEAMFAAFKLAAVPVNVNRHYVADELRPVLADADPAVVLADPDQVDVLKGVVGPGCTLVPTGDDLDRRLGSETVGRPPTERSGSDSFLLYTGGSTGRPKGVLWRHEDVFFAALGGGNLGGPPIAEPGELLEHLAPEPSRTVVASPLMHGTAQWTALAALLSGSTVLLTGDGGFEAAAVLDLVAAEQASHLVLVGDAFALPLADALDAQPERFDLDSLVVVASGGAALSDALAQRLLRHLPGAVVVDGYGSSETGGQGRRVVSPGIAAPGPPRFVPGADTSVLDERFHPLPPGGGVGRLARRGHVPLGYRNDPEGTARSFPVVDGVRWAVTGDLARVEPDGSVTLLGRSERVINSGGEKVYPAEVEAAVLSHPDIRDALALGYPDERFGEAVAVIVVARPGAEVTLEGLRLHCRDHIARFKLPRYLALADQLPRSLTGKVDFSRAVLLLADVRPPAVTKQPPQGHHDC